MSKKIEWNFIYKKILTWPPLAWVAKISDDSQIVNVLSGSEVYVELDWFCEAIWDGDFISGDFDRTDIIAGSGARIRKDQLIFVSSGSTVDRLQYLRIGNDTWISNSLACLLSETDAEINLTYSHYMRDFNSIITGLKNYVSVIHTSKGEIHLVYFDNITVNHAGIEIVPKPFPKRDFSSFNTYHSFLSKALKRIHCNMSDNKRAVQLSFIGTLSTGYDSSMVTALAKKLGVMSEVICFKRPDGRDFGGANAMSMGLKVNTVDVSAWRNYVSPEILFIAGNAFGEEVHFKATEDSLSHKVLLTGYHGDKVWEKELSYTGSDIKRGDISGLALTEFRLSAGFINCPIPFWGVRQVSDINRISNSDQMKKWDVGGDYNRPICRRIVEDTGLGRGSFGIKKSFASRWIMSRQDNFSKTGEFGLLKYLKNHNKKFLKHGKIPPDWFPVAVTFLNEMLWTTSGLLNRLPGLNKLGIKHWWLVRNIVALREPNPPHPPLIIGPERYSFPWAIEGAKHLYRTSESSAKFEAKN